MSEPSSEWRYLWRQMVQEAKARFAQDQQPVAEESVPHDTENVVANSSVQSVEHGVLHHRIIFRYL